ncbi:hypothetical protein GMRT_12657 [Giardia muris]|uniref:Uncharacterized protein n=1 Tax=Giardia muris TaxID=5742 RepID=A0A4Z1T5P4_GIAMU|nr:hypothetical protein GMRT_12657 [Giardia muris]|eukprot:TNJ27849.1 hypothetical protein GMRT_12657 [Giardia muris]
MEFAVTDEVGPSARHVHTSEAARSLLERIMNTCTVEAGAVRIEELERTLNLPPMASALLPRETPTIPVTEAVRLLIGTMAIPEHALPADQRSQSNFGARHTSTLSRVSPPSIFGRKEPRRPGLFGGRQLEATNATGPFPVTLPNTDAQLRELRDTVKNLTEQKSRLERELSQARKSIDDREIKIHQLQAQLTEARSQTSSVASRGAPGGPSTPLEVESLADLRPLIRDIHLAISKDQVATGQRALEQELKELTTRLTEGFDALDAKLQSSEHSLSTTHALVSKQCSELHAELGTVGSSLATMTQTTSTILAELSSLRIGEMARSVDTTENEAIFARVDALSEQIGSLQKSLCDIRTSLNRQLSDLVLESTSTRLNEELAANIIEAVRSNSGETIEQRLIDAMEGVFKPTLETHLRSSLLEALQDVEKRLINTSERKLNEGVAKLLSEWRRFTEHSQLVMAKEPLKAFEAAATALKDDISAIIRDEFERISELRRAVLADLEMSESAHPHPALEFAPPDRSVPPALSQMLDTTLQEAGLINSVVPQSSLNQLLNTRGLDEPLHLSQVGHSTVRVGGGNAGTEGSPLKDLVIQVEDTLLRRLGELALSFENLRQSVEQTAHTSASEATRMKREYLRVVGSLDDINDGISAVLEAESSRTLTQLLGIVRVDYTIATVVLVLVLVLGFNVLRFFL